MPTVDVGISAEQGHVRIRQLNLPNKGADVPLAGLPVALTDTAGIVRSPTISARRTPVHARCAESLAASLGRIVDDPRAMSRAARGELGGREAPWHWEHPAERGALLARLDVPLADIAVLRDARRVLVPALSKWLPRECWRP